MQNLALRKLMKNSKMLLHLLNLLENKLLKMLKKQKIKKILFQFLTKL